MWYPFKNRKKKAKKAKKVKQPKLKFKRRNRKAYKKLGSIERRIRRVNCTHLCPPKQEGPGWYHCDMGDGRMGDCLIFLGKKVECEFHNSVFKPLSRDDIAGRVRTKLAELKFKEDCLKAEMCPKCGYDLEVEMDDHGFVDGKCHVCKKEYVID